jgi:ribosome-associated heat shock protein Hsp15
MNASAQENPALRLDQWLWAVRVYKTRSLSAQAIKDGWVEVNGRPSKPAHPVRPGELVTARLEHGATAWTRTLRVIGSPRCRVGAALVGLYAEDLTPPEELAKRDQREPSLLPPAFRPRGAGRPTKRDRRQIDQWP